MEEYHPPYQYQRGKSGEDLWIRCLFFLSEKIHALIKWRHHKISGGYGRVIYKQKKKLPPVLILVTGMLLGYLLWGPSQEDHPFPEIKEQQVLSKLQDKEVPAVLETGEEEEFPAWEAPEADFQDWNSEEDLLEEEPVGESRDPWGWDEPDEDYPERKRRRDNGYEDEDTADGYPDPGEYETKPGFIYTNYYGPLYDFRNHRGWDEKDKDDKEGETGYGGERKKLFRSFQPPSRETESSSSRKIHGFSKPKSPKYNPSPRPPKKIKEGETRKTPGFSGGTGYRRTPRRNSSSSGRSYSSPRNSRSSSRSRDSSFRNSRSSSRRPGSRPGNSGSSNRGSRSSFRSSGSSPRGSSSSSRSSSFRSSGSSSRSSSSSSSGSRSNPRKK